jgi:hypothetical protein
MPSPSSTTPPCSCTVCPIPKAPDSQWKWSLWFTQ